MAQKNPPINNNVNKRDNNAKKKKFYVRITRTHNRAIVSLGWGDVVFAVLDTGRWSLLKLLPDPFLEFIVSVVLGRVIERAEPLSLLRKVEVSGAEYSVLLWLSNSAPPPRRLFKSLKKAIRRTLEEEGKVDIEDAHRRIAEKLNKILDTLP